MNPTTYRRRSTQIEAVQLSIENALDVAIWVQGDFGTVISGVDPTTTIYWVTLPVESGGVGVAIGDWVVKDGLGRFSSLSTEEFEATYEPAGE